MSRFLRFLSRASEVAGVENAPTVAFDFGSSTTKCCINGKVVYHQPTCLVIHTPTQTVVEIGRRAYGLWGKIPSHLQFVFPFEKGQVSHTAFAALYIQALYAELKPYVSKSWLVKSPVIVGIADTTSELDKASLRETLANAGLNRNYLIEKSRALCTRLKRPATAEGALCVIDIGGQTTEVIFFVGTRVVKVQTIFFGGQQITEFLRQFVKTQYQCEIGWQTAEKLKTQITHLNFIAKDQKQDFQAVVRGKNLIESTPITVSVSAQHVTEKLKPLLDEFIKEILDGFSEVPAELVTSALENGLFLTGGGSLLVGLKEYLSEALHAHIVHSATPFEDVVKGLKL